MLYEVITSEIENRVGTEESAQQELAGHWIIGPALKHPSQNRRERCHVLMVRRRFDAEPADQHDEQAQKQQVEKENESYNFV